MADPLLIVNDLLIPLFDELIADADIQNENKDEIVADPVVRPSERADAQVNGALPLAKRLGTNPRSIAEQIVASGVLDEVCESVEIAGPGFINLTFAPQFLADQIAAVAADDRLGIARTETPKKIIVDYSSPNVAKEMHAGHLRTTIIGDALVRMLDFYGHEVIRENHIGDWGRPFGMLIEHLIDIGEDVAAENFGQGDLDSFYKAANAKFDSDPAFAERARARVPRLQAYDPESIELWQRLFDMSVEYFNEVYTKLGVLLTNDDLAGESKYQSIMDDAYAALVEQGLVTESDGAQVIFPPGFSNRDGEPLPLIAKSSAGAYMYAMSDVACVYDRTVNIGADLALYVVGAPQAHHFQMVFAVAELAGWIPEGRQFIHVGFGSVLGADRKPLRSRAGDSVKLIELIDEAVERAAAAVAERNPDLDVAQQAEVARMVGIGSLKYADLSTDRVKDYVFDFDRLIAFEGDTGGYLQYAHARICSVFRRAGIDRQGVRSAAVALGEAAEKSLAQQLLAYPKVLADTVATYSPHKLCTYLFELAQLFSAFYEHCPILRAPTAAIRDSRLVLADVTGRTIAHGLDLLGIEAPPEM